MSDAEGEQDVEHLVEHDVEPADELDQVEVAHAALAAHARDDADELGHHDGPPVIRQPVAPVVDLEPAVAMAGLDALRDRRRRRRTAQVEWFDAFYQAYVIALFAGVAILLGSGLVGGGPVSDAGVERILADAPSVLGLLTALALAAGLRSGSRGGPLALEPAEVQQALLAPVPRRQALMGPAVRQVRFLLFAAAVTGAVAGQLVARRLDGGIVAWATVAALWAMLTVGGAVACGWLASGHRLDRRLATLIGALVIAWSVGDLTEVLPQAPTTELGRLPLWPLDAEPLVVVPALVIVAGMGLGLASLGGTSLEHAQRRSALVGELRFAATMRDLRTVMVLRRQLSQEQARARPWVPARRRGGRTVVVLRGWRSLDRIPASRLLRLAGLGVGAALAARAAWGGATPLIIVAGVLAFVAALDAVEPLAQEVDHPAVTELAPVDLGSVLVRHLIVPVVTMLGVSVVGLLAVATTRPDGEGWIVAGVTAITAALAATAGAAISTVKDIRESGSSAAAQTESLMPPEAAGTRIIFQAIWPPAVAIFGFVPMVLARHATTATDGDPVRTVLVAALGVATVAVLVAGWVRFRQEIHTYLEQAMDQQMGAAGARDGRA